MIRNARRITMEKILKDKYIEIKVDRLLEHVGHDLTVATYGNDDNIVNIAIECEECNEVIGDIDI
jgi:hypothetical protein